MYYTYYIVWICTHTCMLLHTSCREPGVRNLQKQIEKLVRKVAFQIATKEAAKVTVTDGNLEKFVGPPIFAKDRIFDSTPAGVVMGLAWTSMGGATLFIESVAVASADKAALRCTGQVCVCGCVCVCVWTCGCVCMCIDLIYRVRRGRERGQGRAALHWPGTP